MMLEPTQVTLTLRLQRWATLDYGEEISSHWRVMGLVERPENKDNPGNGFTTWISQGQPTQEQANEVMQAEVNKHAKFKSIGWNLVIDNNPLPTRKHDLNPYGHI